MVRSIGFQPMQKPVAIGGRKSGYLGSPKDAMILNPTSPLAGSGSPWATVVWLTGILPKAWSLEPEACFTRL